MRTPYSIFFVVSFVALVVTNLKAAEQPDPATALTPFLNQDTFAVAYLDSASLPAKNPSEILRLVPGLQPEFQSRLTDLTTLNSMVKKFQDAGGQRVYLIAGLADVHIQGGPILIATTAPGKRPEPLAQVFQDAIQNIRDDKSQAAAHPLAVGLTVRHHGDVILVGSNDTVNHYDLLVSSPRNDLTESISRLAQKGAVAAAVFAPGPDFRRVVRELWPPLPPPLTELDSELADRWLTLEVAIHQPPSANPRVVLHTADAESAQTFVDLYHRLPAAVDEFADDSQRKQIRSLVESLIALMPATIDNTRVELSASAAAPQIDALQKMIATLSDKALESSRRSARANQFKQLLLAILNYADVYKHLPPAAICDKNGKPLLSWRVAILPYIDQRTLFDQFHLEEPWDSPHNRTLIAKMPATFADPDPKIRQAAGDGKTTFQVPVGPDTVFSNNEGTTYKEITDGTSHTLILIEVDPIHTAIWTRPEDWQVDMEHPLHGIERTDRKYITAGFADGHVAAMPTDEDPKTVRAILTRAGGETVAQPPY